MASSRIDDPTPPDPSAKQLYGDALKSGSGTAAPAVVSSAPKEADLLAAVRDANRISLQYQTQTITRKLARSYRAWQNEHDEGSKYRSQAWRGRSRLFVPKTRSAVRKQMATATAAFFSTDDVVNISAAFEDDDVQRASADVISADLNYRLTSSSRKSGIPWFMIAMGAVNDSSLTGVCISKEYWEYETVDTEEPGMVLENPDDPESAFVESMVPVKKIVRDRPMIDLMPIENARVDPAAPWYDVAQLGAWFIMRYPMHISDLRAMMQSDGKNGVEQGWLPDVSDELLLKGRDDDHTTSTRTVREGNSDRYDEINSAVNQWDIVWIQENFVRADGHDWHFWSVEHHGLLSEIRETEEVYPAHQGDRPYTFGVGALDPHKVYPMAPVESWQPLQLELNDLVNLRLDTLKRSIAPLATEAREGARDILDAPARAREAWERRRAARTTVQASELEAELNAILYQQGQPCQKGQTAKSTGCTPASGEGGGQAPSAGGGGDSSGGSAPAGTEDTPATKPEPAKPTRTKPKPKPAPKPPAKKPTVPKPTPKPVKPKPLTPEEKTRALEKEKPINDRSPDPLGKPISKEQGRLVRKHAENAHQLLCELSEARQRVIAGARVLNASYRSLDGIARMLESGATLEDVRHVIAVREQEVRDGGDARWFDHVSPFRPQNFERSLARPLPQQKPSRREQIEREQAKQEKQRSEALARAAEVDPDQVQLLLDEMKRSSE